MGIFSGSKKDRFGIIIDIGSGSVLTAIVHSKAKTKHPMIVWAHREHIALKQIDSVEHSARAVLAALMNASLKLDKDGRIALNAYQAGAKLTAAQCSIAAPWSYTVTKTINVAQDEAIDITSTLIEELVLAAQKQVEEELRAHTSNADIGLAVIAKSTMDLLSNGYRVKEPTGEKAITLTLTQATVVAQKYMIDGLDEVQSKLFPRAKVESLSFILMLYCSIRSLFPHTDDVCLVDITDEASEIGVVRDGSLKYSTHTPFGMFSLAREVSRVCNIPLHEALGHLRAETIQNVKARLPESKHESVSTIFDEYIKRLATLLNETGDSLSIPKQIFLHVEESYAPLFIKLIERAAKAATKIDHTVISITDKVTDTEQQRSLSKQINHYSLDTALLLNAEFFHKQDHCLDLEYS